MFQGCLGGDSRDVWAQKAKKAQTALLGRALIVQHQLPSMNLSANRRSVGEMRGESLFLLCPVAAERARCWQHASSSAPLPLAQPNAGAGGFPPSSMASELCCTATGTRSNVLEESECLYGHALTMGRASSIFCLLSCILTLKNCK